MSALVTCPHCDRLYTHHSLPLHESKCQENPKAGARLAAVVAELSSKRTTKPLLRPRTRSISRPAGVEQRLCCVCGEPFTEQEIASHERKCMNGEDGTCEATELERAGVSVHAEGRGRSPCVHRSEQRGGGSLPGAATLPATSPRLGGSVASPSPMNCPVCRKIFAAIALTLLLEHHTTEAQEPFKMWTSVTKDICERSTQSGFFTYDTEFVLFNRATRRITKRVWTWNPYRTNSVYSVIDWHWNDTETGLGLYVSFRHLNSDMRRNDNPPTNPRQLNSTFRESYPDTGTGSDFSAFYKGNPVFFEASFYYDNPHRLFKKLAGSKCGQTGAWVANEGFYKWDYETNEWTPIYYLPWNADFYY
ncbi:unnamed protein product [Heligmosomoides polygyrus]|uniref:C2H2-type domain-containing protein n=1 Tax=Heligmosomoides polygyrus TaxID=6339 RepID=A0A3P7XYL5_HELPZ|nr:unnamed protein product [Heligmosomoides polygyrus]